MRDPKDAQVSTLQQDVESLQLEKDDIAKKYRANKKTLWKTAVDFQQALKSGRQTSDILSELNAVVYASEE